MADRSLPLLLGLGAGAALLWRAKPRHTMTPARPTSAAWVDPKPRPARAPEPAKSAAGSSTPPTNSPAPTPTPLAGRWVWPVPTWNNRKPTISDGWGSPRDGGAGRHEGVDIMFKRHPGDPFAPGTPNGSRGHVMPDLVAVAASDGVIWSATWTPRGFAVVIDHGQKLATYYTHLSRLLVAATSRARSGQRVYAGQPIGVIGFDPKDSQRIKHLHFALWRGGPREAVDPAPLMRAWEYIADPRPTSAPMPAPTPAGPLTVARNASLRYRKLGERGERYPA